MEKHGRYAKYELYLDGNFDARLEKLAEEQQRSKEEFLELALAKYFYAYAYIQGNIGLEVREVDADPYANMTGPDL